ncbi:hypothetical protein OEZ86_007980 [Tetradesmus obliquus]|nr:hypothetical protein OEZ86_007980 [Tetradesmus obliquus]
MQLSSKHTSHMACKRALLPHCHTIRAYSSWTTSASGNAAGGGSSGSSSSSSSSSSNSSLLGTLQKWNQDTRKLREQLQSLGLAGVVAYGLFNTLYYTVAFLVVWFTVANVPAGLGAQAAMRKAAEVFALVWAGSQVTKLLRSGGALAFAPVVDKGLEAAVAKLRLKSKQQAFALVVAACLALAAAVFGAVVAMHM